MNLQSLLPAGICLLLIVFFFSLVISNAVNIPNGDDLYCLLLFTQQFKDASTLTERLQLLLQQWVEHRIVYSRLAALVSYWLTSHVNFVTIIVIGNLTLVGFTILFWKVIRRTGVSLYYLIPVVLTLFGPVAYEANLWAGASTVYMPVGFLGLLTIYLLVYHGQAGVVLALLTALLATFSFGNGMFSFVAGLLVLLYQSRLKTAFLWTITGIAAVFLYFHDFKMYSGTNAFRISEHFKNPLYLFYNLFGFLGGTVDYTENVGSPVVAANIPALVFGFLIFVAICGGGFLLIKERLLEKEISGDTNLKVTWLGMVAFILITSVVMAYSRTSGEGMNTLSSRYKIYSMVSWILLYCFLLIYSRKKKLVGLIFGVLSLIMLLFNYYTSYDKLTNYKSYFLSGLFNYNYNKEWVIYRHTDYYEDASKIISDSIAGNPEPVYVFNPVFPHLSREELQQAPMLENIEVSERTDCNGRPGKCISLHTNDYPNVSNYFKGIYLVVYNDTNIYLFVANPVKNGRLNMFTKGDYYKKGFFLDSNFGAVLKPGSRYNLAIFCPTEAEKIKRIHYKIDG